MDRGWDKTTPVKYKETHSIQQVTPSSIENMIAHPKTKQEMGLLQKYALISA